MKVVIVGGGAGGSFAALLLARAGHDVAVLDQDDLEPASDVEAAAAAAFRPTAPQIVHPHMVGAACRQLLVERLPDVYDALLAAGVREAELSTQMPATLVDQAAASGDEQLTMLMTRRSTFDWVVQRAVRAEPGITVRGGLRVTGLIARAGRPPHVTGLRTSGGDVRADLVVDAAGRRSPIDGWLHDIDARPTAARSAECGLAYFSRHYRVRRAAALPGPLTTRAVTGLDEFTAGIWGADNETMLLAAVPLAADRRFSTLKHPDAFTAVLRTVPGLASWLDALEPTSAIFQMAGLHNTLRRLVVDGAPVVLGLHAIGDSVCTTNPTLSRGLNLALITAADLTATLDDHADDWTSQAQALDALVAQHVVSFYEDQAAIDHARLVMLRRTIFDHTAADSPSADPRRVTYAQLRTAARFDPVAFRGFWKIQGMVCRPNDVYTDPAVVASTRDVLRACSTTPSIRQPTQEQLLAALAA